MEFVYKGIVFSNDIALILKGRNALDFNYEKNGMFIPNESQIELLRADFKKDVNRIFDGEVTIYSEKEMKNFITDSLIGVEDYPHCFIR